MFISHNNLLKIPVNKRCFPFLVYIPDAQLKALLVFSLVVNTYLQAAMRTAGVEYSGLYTPGYLGVILRRYLDPSHFVGSAEYYSCLYPGMFFSIVKHGR